MDNAEFNPRPGSVDSPEPGIRRILAPNPSPMTFRGTNTYLIGQGDVVVVDPGPALPAHHSAILAALNAGERISHILVTHSHIDHSPLAQALSASTGAKIYAYGDSYCGRSAIMEQLSKAGLTGGGEGLDPDFAPQERLGDGDRLVVGGQVITALWTPGHFGNHLCFGYGDAVFTGDIIMGWASTMVSPPDGDLSAFLGSAAMLAELNARIFYPGHGAPVLNPTGRANWLIKHRKSREQEILAQLGGTGQSIADITAAIYTDVPSALLPAAERNVLAHLIDLSQRDLVLAEPSLSHKAVFSKT